MTTSFYYMQSISFIVPTAGRPEIENCLMSIVPQLSVHDEVIVVGDTLDGPLLLTEQIVSKFRVRYLEYQGTEHTWGHEQMNYGIANASGRYLCFNDDDDIWVPGAVAKIRPQLELHTQRPVLFRYLSYFGYLSWVKEGLTDEGYLGGHSLVCPNDPSKLGKWTDRYEGDWDFVHDTLQHYDDVVWCKDVIAIARPDKTILDELYKITA